MESNLNYPLAHVYAIDPKWLVLAPCVNCESTIQERESCSGIRMRFLWVGLGSSGFPVYYSREKRVNRYGINFL